jgi:carbon monoxide dehydrogenase subunit G
MAGFEMNEWIAQPPLTVFNFVTDTTNASKVIPSVQRMEQISDGALGVGTRYRETRIVDGHSAQTELEVVEFDPPQRYAVANSTMGVETVYRYTFTPHNGGTQINLVCKVTANGLRKAAIPLVVALLKREDGDHLARLKKAIAR